MALSTLYGRPIHIHTLSGTTVVTCPDDANNAPIHLSYIRGNHYDAIVPAVDPLTKMFLKLRHLAQSL